MSNEIASASGPDRERDDESPRDAGSTHNNTYSRRGADTPIPSPEDCLRAIAALPGLVAMRILTPAQSNSIRATYAAILQHHDRARHGQSAQLADDDVLKLWRDQPHLINLLHPILTQAQLDMIMRGAR